MPSDLKRTSPHVCQKCGLCCQGRGDLYGDEESWVGDTEPDDCTGFDHEKKQCNVYDCRRDFCEEYPWDEYCEREQKEMGIWTDVILVDGKLATRDMQGNVTITERPK